MVNPHRLLAALPLLLDAALAQGKWEFYAFEGLRGMLSYGRLDPIISPGVVSSHVHQFQGGNAVGATYDYDTYRSQSDCSTIQVQEDLSNYWAPALYHYDGASNFSLLLSGFHIYYQFLTYGYDAHNASGSTKRYPFPKGLTMLAGNPLQRSINQSDPASRASIFQCQQLDSDGPYSHDMRDFQRMGLQCDNDLRATTLFPSCWDGVADNSDLTHVVYPGPRPGQVGSVCPESHPMAFMQLTYEWYWPVQNFPFDPTREDNWVFSFGDTSGFGFHGDFANGWDIDALTDAIESCNKYEFGIEDCQPFAAYNVSDHTIPPCMPSGLYPNEDVGLDGSSLTALPGCNPVWRDNSTKPTCDDPPTDPPIDLQWGPDLSQWNYLSCPLAWHDDGLILTAHQRLNWTDMTADSCLAECAGYTYAMMSWGINCFCDNEIQNGGSTISDPDYTCSVRCPTKYLQFCGGLGSGELFKACQGDECHANAAFAPRHTAPAAWLGSGSTAVYSATSTSTSSVATSTAAAQTTSTATPDQDTTAHQNTRTVDGGSSTATGASGVATSISVAEASSTTAGPTSDDTTQHPTHAHTGGGGGGDGPSESATGVHHGPGHHTTVSSGSGVNYGPTVTMPGPFDPYVTTVTVTDWVTQYVTV